MFPLLLVGGLLGGLAFLVFRAERGRTITLINGRRYAIAFRTNGPGFDTSMFPGFCNFSDIIAQVGLSIPVNVGGDGLYELQFSADWCAANTVWSVPDNVAISEL